MIDRTEEEIMREWGVDNPDNPLVSVRCITYNHEPYIAQALDGFLMQKTNFPFEVIVHDDASTDRTADIVREYEKKYPKIIKAIYQTENQYSKWDGSIGRIMNAACKGKYIALCEGDDYWIDENKLQMQVDFLEKNPEYTMCFHSAKIQNELDPSYEENIYIGLSDRDYSPTDLFSTWTVPTASVVMRKACYDYPIRNIDKFIYGDIRVVESCAHMGKVRCINKYMSVYRIQSLGLTWDKKRDNQRFLRLPNHYLAIKENFPLIKKRVINDKIVESYLLCSLKCGTIIDKVCWCFQALCISPNAVFRNIIIYLRRKMC